MNFSSKVKIVPRLMVLLMLSLVGFAKAVVIDDILLVDFGTIVPTTGNYNVIHSGQLSVSDLVRASDGTTTGVTLSVTSTNPFDNSGNVASISGVTELNTTDAAVYGDGFLSANGGNGANNDTVTITFTGLNDDLSYDLVAGLSRNSRGNNFSSVWSIAAAPQQVSDGTPADGHVQFRGLNSTSGSLVISLTDAVRQSGLAQLSLTARSKVNMSNMAEGNLPRILKMTRDSVGDVVMTLDREASLYVVEQSEDLVRFHGVDSTVEAINDKQIRIDVSDIMQVNGGNKVFFRISRKPNFIILFTDDQGYQDLSCYGSTTISTPKIDTMASQGIRFTDFYAQVVCGPSRDALMTGCYPLRTAHHPNIINGDSDRTSPHPRLELSEITLAEILKTEGYVTSHYGKWDLAGRFQFQSNVNNGPLAQGFDSTHTEPNRAEDTQSNTNSVISFIQENKEQPFFAYVAYHMPHIELATTSPFAGISEEGIYADVMAELDHNVGRILDTLVAEELDTLTYVIFMSDNGPWYLGNSSVHINRYGSSTAAEEMGGLALPLRGDKTTSWEGGFRVPSIMWAPGRIPAGQVCTEMATTMDVMPTIARIVGATIPSDRVIDGRDIAPLIFNHPGATSPRDSFFYYVRETLHAVRVGKWKLHVPRANDTFWERFYRTGDYINITSPLLYDLEVDIGETTDVSAQHPDVVADLMQHINFARSDIGDFDTIGANAR